MRLRRLRGSLSTDPHQGEVLDEGSDDAVRRRPSLDGCRRTRRVLKIGRPQYWGM